MGLLAFAGKMEQAGELTEKEIIRIERNSGVISNRVREIQVSMISYEWRLNLKWEFTTLHYFLTWILR